MKYFKKGYTDTLTNGYYVLLISKPEEVLNALKHTFPGSAEDAFEQEFKDRNLSFEGAVWPIENAELGVSAMAMVLVDRGGDIESFVETLTHELVHLTVGRFGQTGIPVSADNEETFAYFYTMMFLQYYDGLKKYIAYRNKKKKGIKDVKHTDTIDKSTETNGQESATGSSKKACRKTR